VNQIDLESAEQLFAESTDFTVGLEEEFAILDPGTLDMVPRYEDLSSAAAEDPVLAASVCGELIASEIEIRSGRGQDFAAALASQREARRRLFGLAGSRGVALGATGTHPWADFREQRIIDTEHYRRVEEGLKYVAWRNNTFSVHVHVGVRGADRAVRVCDRLRPVLPLLLAVSANSTWLDGRDSGLHSARTQAFTKSFPRCGIPDAYGTWAAYREYVEFLTKTGSIIEDTQIWWSVRPHFRFGTVEVRICDAQATAAESEGLSALMVACVTQAARDHDEGRPFGDPPRRLVEENFWRAIRHGQDGRMIDLETATEYPSAEIVERLAEWTAPMRSELRLEIALPEHNGAQRQRRALDAGASLEDVYADVVSETASTYVQEVTA
jgi:glutamate---cysteine ligase / carboxylate-amine ligase